MWCYIVIVASGGLRVALIGLVIIVLKPMWVLELYDFDRGCDKT